MNESHVSRLGQAAGGAPAPSLSAAPGTPRRRFLDFVRDPRSHRPPLSPFLPYPDVVASTLGLLGITPSGDGVADEISLARALDYEPMFMVGCTQFIFPWTADEAASDQESVLYILPTSVGTWTRLLSRGMGLGAF